MARTPLLITPIRCIRRRIRPIRIAAERLGDDSFDPHRVLRRGWRAKEATASASSLVLSDGTMGCDYPVIRLGLSRD